MILRVTQGIFVSTSSICMTPMTSTVQSRSLQINMSLCFSGRHVPIVSSVIGSFCDDLALAF